MSYEELVVKLGLNEAFISNVKMVLKSNCDFTRLTQVFHDMGDDRKSTGHFFEEVKKEAKEKQLDYRIVFGALYIQLALDVYEVYKCRVIDDQVYFDTMSDLDIWSRDCYQKFGVWGIDEYNWIINHMRLKLFKLGRLQFEPITLGESINCRQYALPRGAHVLNVHIPAGGPLGHDQCRESYELAKTFFKDENIKFVCSSWLLSPVYKEILPESSNIVKFQKDYCIYEIDDLSTQAEERIFGEVRSNPDLYEQNTTLQKVAATHLKQGRKLGVGSGILVI